MVGYGCGTSVPMRSGNSRWMLPAALIGLLFVLWTLPAGATVYSWKGEGGVLTVSNDPRDVPEERRASVRTFTAKRAPRRPPQEAPAPDPSGTESAPLDAYERGYQHGLEAAERQVALAEELARTILAAVPQTPPAPIVITQPASPAYSPYGDYAAPYNYPYAPYAPYVFGFPFAFGERFVLHRRFFPDAGGRRFGPFFPHRHVMLSRTPIGRMR